MRWSNSLFFTWFLLWYLSLYPWNHRHFSSLFNLQADVWGFRAPSSSESPSHPPPPPTRCPSSGHVKRWGGPRLWKHMETYGKYHSYPLLAWRECWFSEQISKTMENHDAIHRHRPSLPWQRTEANKLADPVWARGSEQVKRNRTCCLLSWDTMNLLMFSLTCPLISNTLPPMASDGDRFLAKSCPGLKHLRKGSRNTCRKTEPLRALQSWSLKQMSSCVFWWRHGDGGGSLSSQQAHWLIEWLV